MIENIWKAFNAEGVNHNVLEALGQTVWVTVRLVPQKQSDQSPNHLHLYLHLESMLANISFSYPDLYILGNDKRGIFHANQTPMYLDPHHN